MRAAGGGLGPKVARLARRYVWVVLAVGVAVALLMLLPAR